MWPTLKTWEYSLVYFFIQLTRIFSRKNKRGAGSSKRLVDSRRHNVRIAKWRRIFTSGNQPCDMRHIHHKQRSAFIRDISEFLPINDPRICGKSGYDEFWLMKERYFFQFIKIKPLCFFAYPIGNLPPKFSRSRDFVPVSKMPSVIKVSASGK